MRSRTIVASSVLWWLLAVALPMPAADVTWTGGTSGNWDMSENWDTHLTPTPADHVYVTGASDEYVYGPLAATTTISSLTIGNLGAMHTLDLAASTTLKVEGDISLRVNGRLNISEAFIDAHSIISAGGGWFYGGFQGSSITVRGGLMLPPFNELIFKGYFAPQLTLDGATLSFDPFNPFSSTPYPGSRLVIADGRARVTIQNGGSAAVETLVTGDGGLSEGTLEVTGANSSLIVSGDARVGRSGPGRAEFLPGAQGKFDGNVYLAELAGATGSFIVRGSSVVVDGQVNAGGAGKSAFLRVDQGGHLQTGSARLGSTTTSGQLVISGPGSRWDINGDLTLIGDKQFSAMLEDGGILQANRLFLRAVPQGIWSDALINVYRASGQRAAGRLEIKDRSEVSPGSRILLGTQGVFTCPTVRLISSVDGAATLEVGNEALVQTNQLILESIPSGSTSQPQRARVSVLGGRIEAGSLMMGYFAGHRTSLEIGSNPVTLGEVIVAGSVLAGAYGDSTVMINDGVLRLTGGPGMGVALAPGSVGDVTVTGARGQLDAAGRSIAIAGDIPLSGGPLLPGGAGTLQVQNGGTLLADKLLLGATGIITVDAASIKVNSLDNTAGGTFRLLGGGLLEADSIAGSLLVEKGTLSAHSPSAPVTAVGNLSVNVAAAGQLTTPRGFTGAANTAVTKEGEGIWEVSGGINLAAKASLDAKAGIINTDTIRGGSLSIRSGAKVLLKRGSGVSVLTGLTLDGTAGNWQGQIDLADNDLIVQTDASTAQTTLDRITSQIVTARDGQLGRWIGEGIASSAAAADASGLMGLAAIRNLDRTGETYFSSFDGQPVDTSSILIKYTWNGDANLDGKLDASDYFMIDSGFLSKNSPNPLTGYANGDFDYSGKIDASDYFLIDKAFLGQKWQLSAAAGAAAVPEPAALVLLLPVFIALRRRLRGCAGTRPPAGKLPAFHHRAGQANRQMSPGSMRVE